MGLLLVLLFIVVPIAELYVIIQVGEWIGVWPTLLLLLLDAIVGSWLLKHEGRAACRRRPTERGLASLIRKQRRTRRRFATPTPKRCRACWFGWRTSKDAERSARLDRTGPRDEIAIPTASASACPGGIRPFSARC